MNIEFYHWMLNFVIKCWINHWMLNFIIECWNYVEYWNVPLNILNLFYEHWNLMNWMYWILKNWKFEFCYIWRAIYEHKILPKSVFIDITKFQRNLVDQAIKLFSGWMVESILILVLIGLRIQNWFYQNLIALISEVRHLNITPLKNHKHITKKRFFLISLKLVNMCSFVK